MPAAEAKPETPELILVSRDEVDVQIRSAVLREREACRQIAMRKISAAQYMDGDWAFRNGARHAAAMIVKAIQERA